MAAGLRQSDVALAAGLSQPRISELERGLGAPASLETWARTAAAVGEQLVGFLELAPGATPPRDIQHLRRQAALIDHATAGGWVANPEFALDPGVIRSRSIDVVLLRVVSREATLVEIWDWFDDVGNALRSLDGKALTLASRLGVDGTTDAQHPWAIRSLFVVRRTRRNQRLIAELRALFSARFPARSSEWLRALVDPAVSMPARDGLLWSTAAGALEASRLTSSVRRICIETVRRGRLSRRPG